MHEMGIVHSILDAAHNELERRAGDLNSEVRLTEIGVRIGEFAGVDPDSLRFCFEAVVKSTDLEPLTLDILWCRAGDAYDNGRCYTGEELELAYLDFDDVNAAPLDADHTKGVAV